MLLYGCSFAFVFHAVVPQADHFKQPVDALLKTLSMTLGELDFSDLFNVGIRFRPDDDRLVSTVVVWLLLLLFLFLLLIRFFFFFFLLSLCRMRGHYMGHLLR